MSAEQEVGPSDIGLHVESMEEEGVRNRGGAALCIAQIEAMGGFASWATPRPGKLEPEEGLAHSWEVQWQEFLKAIHMPHCVAPEQPQTMRWEVTKSSLVPSEMVADPSGETGAGAGEARELWSALKGEAPKATQDSGKQGEADTVDKELVNTSILSTEARRQCFRLFRYHQAEGPRMVCSRLHELCYQWLHPETSTKEQILEQLILEQFLAILPPAMQSWVREGSPESCYQAVVLAEDFLLGQQEAEGWEEQVMGGSAEVVVNFPGDHEIALELYEELKQERNATLLESNKVPNDYEMERKDLEELEVNFVDAGETERQAEPWENSAVPLSGVDIPETEVPQPVTQERLSTPFRKRLGQKINPERHAEPKLYICTECGHSFTRKANLFRHQQLHTGQKSYLCPVCGRSFTRRENLIRHQRVHSASQVWTIQNEEGIPQMPLEGTNTTEVKKRKREEQLQVENRNDESVAGKVCFKIAPPHAGPPSVKKNTCLICGKSFTRKSTLNRHQKNHMGKMLLKCSDCGKNFSQASTGSRRPEAAMQLGKNPFQCVKCEGKSHQKMNSKKSHKGKKPFKCMFCEHSFNCRSHLVRHQRIHTGEKPYTCPLCGKNFRQTAHLVKHKRTHGSQKRYA